MIGYRLTRAQSGQRSQTSASRCRRPATGVAPAKRNPCHASMWSAGHCKFRPEPRLTPFSPGIPMGDVTASLDSLTEQGGPVLWLAINREARRNAMGHDVLAGMGSAIEDADLKRLAGQAPCRWRSTRRLGASTWRISPLPLRLDLWTSQSLSIPRRHGSTQRRTRRCTGSLPRRPDPSATPDPGPLLHGLHTCR